MNLKRCMTLLLTFSLLIGALGAYPSLCATAEMAFSPAVSLGNDFAVALCANGNAVAWGNNSYGQLGNGSKQSSLTPVDVTMPSVGGKKITFRQVSAGQDHALAIAADGTLWSWGSDANGQLGNRSVESTHEDSLIPKQITKGINGKQFIKIATGIGFSMALSSDGCVYVWGTAQNGVLGDNNPIGDYVAYPQKIEALTSYYITDISVGASTAAARDASGNVYLWGQNDQKQAGQTGSSPVLMPTLKDNNTEKTIKAVSVGTTHTAFLMQDGTVQSFGSNTYGQLGIGAPLEYATHMLKPLSGNLTVKRLAVGDEHTVALSADGRIYAWGNNADAQISADSDSAMFMAPTEVTSTLWEKPVSVSAYGDRSAVVDSLGYIFIWGTDPSSAKLETPTPLKDENGANFSLGIPPESYTQSSDITLQATVPAPVFTVTVPATLDAGDLVQAEKGSAAALSVTNFEVRVAGVDNLFGEKQITVSVSSDGDVFVLRDGAHSLPYAIYNVETGGTPLPSGANFASFTENGVHKGRLEIDQSEITRKGSYSGTVAFTVRTEACAGD